MWAADHALHANAHHRCWEISCGGVARVPMRSCRRSAARWRMSRRASFFVRRWVVVWSGWVVRSAASGQGATVRVQLMFRAATFCPIVGMGNAMLHASFHVPTMHKADSACMRAASDGAWRLCPLPTLQNHHSYTQAFIKDEVTGYVPSAADLDYPGK